MKFQLIWGILPFSHLPFFNYIFFSPKIFCSEHSDSFTLLNFTVLGNNSLCDKCEYQFNVSSYRTTYPEQQFSGRSEKYLLCSENVFFLVKKQVNLSTTHNYPLFPEADNVIWIKDCKINSGMKVLHKPQCELLCIITCQYIILRITSRLTMIGFMNFF